MVTHLLAAVMATGLTVGATDLPSTNELALAEAACQYRIQVYDTFRENRDEFDRRRAEWIRLDNAWRAAGRPDKEVPKLLSWLEQATAASRPDAVEALPEAPRIAADPDASKKSSAPWTLLIPHPAADSPASAADSKASPATDNGSQQPNKVATPVSSKSTLDHPLLDEQKPADETAPVSPPAVPNSAAPGSASAQPAASAADGAWIYSLGEELAQGCNDFALTLSWKREGK